MLSKRQAWKIWSAALRSAGGGDDAFWAWQRDKFRLWYISYQDDQEKRRERDNRRAASSAVRTFRSLDGGVTRVCFTITDDGVGARAPTLVLDGGDDPE